MAKRIIISMGVILVLLAGTAGYILFGNGRAADVEPSLSTSVSSDTGGSRLTPSLVLVDAATFARSQLSEPYPSSFSFSDYEYGRAMSYIRISNSSFCLEYAGRSIVVASSIDPAELSEADVTHSSCKL